MSKHKKHIITLLPGDGIGPEITNAMKRVVEATGVLIEWEEHLAGKAAMDKGGDPLPQEVMDSILRNKIALKGPLTTEVGKGFRSVNVQLRKTLNLYANLRPTKSVPSPNTRYMGLDIVVVRENTESLYAGIENEISPGVVQASKIITRDASIRIAKFAFEYARKHKRKKITAIHKANIMKLADGLFLACCREVAEKFPEVQYNEMIVDNCCMQLVMNPNQFDMLLLENLYGDIVSDLCAGLVGGLGVVPGANIGTEASVFEAVHGSAPDIAGKGIANPTAMIFSTALMLEHIGEKAAATKMVNAIYRVLGEGKTVTPDLKGLVAAYELKKKGLNAVVLEQGRVGGVIGSMRVGQEHVDVGPITVRVESQDFLDLIEELNLRPLYANDSLARLVFLGGTLKLIPRSISELVQSDILSLVGKLRILKEPFISKTNVELTLADFATQRFGAEVCEHLLNPLTLGTFGTEPSNLSAKYAMSFLWKLEQEYGSVIRGLKKQSSFTQPKKELNKLLSFENGLNSLVEALSQRVHIMSFEAKQIRVRSFLEIINSKGEVVIAKKVLLANPLPQAARLIERHFPELAMRFSSVSYSPLVQVMLVSSQIASFPKAFGVLVPTKENRKILGVIFNSRLFPSRFQNGVCTVFFGGKHGDNLIQQTDEELIHILRSEMVTLLNYYGKDDTFGIKRWKHAIPVYGLGYEHVLSEVEEVEAKQKKFYFVGNWREGISVSASIVSAKRVVTKMAQVMDAD
ncbi:hypothetical protein CHS0354_000636 [Potamilus streckersoni]|uniref:Isocitric dehydrogenase subunit alpha n=1 Tax=Potamilus streckersoni TaxID=2493646 RepID=A0AAE0T723_9BIVA|nr:hypothetical protein CHS0354_000636 [Potamilus streckersoni]